MNLSEDSWISPKQIWKLYKSRWEGGWSYSSERSKSSEMGIWLIQFASGKKLDDENEEKLPMQNNGKNRIYEIENDGQNNNSEAIRLIQSKLENEVFS